MISIKHKSSSIYFNQDQFVMMKKFHHKEEFNLPEWEKQFS